MDIEKIIFSNFPTNQASILYGITFGNTKNLSSFVKSVFLTMGLYHLFAASGFHVNIVANTISRSLSFISSKILVIIATTIGIGTYAFLASLSPSVLRASVMFLFFVVSRLVFERKSGYVSSLLFSALLVLIIDTSLITSVSFQLSYVAVLGIYLFSKVRPLSSQLSQRFLHSETHSIKLISNTSLLGSLLDTVRDLFWVSISASIAVGPLVLFYFPEFSFASVVTTFFLAWLVPIILTLTVAFLFFLSLGITPVVFLLKHMLSFISQLLLETALIISKPSSVFVFHQTISLDFLIMYYSIIFFCIPCIYFVSQRFTKQLI